jgi:hypothetical protein
VKNNEMAVRLHELAHAIKVWDGDTPAAQLLDDAAERLRDCRPVQEGDMVNRHEVVCEFQKLISRYGQTQWAEGVRECIAVISGTRQGDMIVNRFTPLGKENS